MKSCICAQCPNHGRCPNEPGAGWPEGRRVARPECAKCTYSPCGYIYGHDCPGFRPKDEAPATEDIRGEMLKPEAPKPSDDDYKGDGSDQQDLDDGGILENDECPRCGGQEVVRVDYDEWITCPDCNGTGKKAEK